MVGQQKPIFGNILDVFAENDKIWVCVITFTTPSPPHLQPPKTFCSPSKIASREYPNLDVAYPLYHPIRQVE